MLNQSTRVSDLVPRRVNFFLLPTKHVEQVALVVVQLDQDVQRNRALVNDLCLGLLARLQQALVR